MNRYKELAKRVFARLVAEYRINYIFAAEQAPVAKPDEAAVEFETRAHRAILAASTTLKMRSSQSYAKAGLAGLVLTENGTPLSVAHFAERAQYDRHSTWPLHVNEAALMDIATEESARGRGLAVMLIRAATRHYLTQGRKRLIAFIWWSNDPSQKAFRKAGWRRIGLSIEIRVGSRWLGLRVPLPHS